MTEKKYKWHKIAEHTNTIEWQTNGMAVIEIAGKKITLGKLENRLFACAHKCPHAGGIMAEGFVDSAGNLVCPLHRYRFNPANGRNVTGEGYYLNTYLAEVRDDGVYVGIEEKGLFSWL